MKQPLDPFPISRVALARGGRTAAALVLAVAALDWVGWATGNQRLIHIHPAWPPMMPWTALWLAALALAILVPSGRPQSARVWAGRGGAVVVGLSAAVVLAEYVSGRAFGIDQVWFGHAVRATQSTWPGRPSAQTALSTLFLCVGVALTHVDRRWSSAVSNFTLLLAAATPWVTVLAYLFETVDLIQISEKTGMALMTAISLQLLVIATLAARPDRSPLAWLIYRPNREVLIRLTVVVASFPIFVGLSRRAFLSLGVDADTALTVSTAAGTAVVGAIMLFLGRREQQLIEAIESDRMVLRATTDAMLDPQILFDPVRDSGGRITDFTYADVNQATCAYLGVRREDLVGQSLAETFPNIRESGLLARYAQCAETGESVVVDDFPFFNGVLSESRRYDIRGARAQGGSISVNYRDVTDRYEAARRLAESEEQYRLLAENSTDIVCHVRDAKLVWVSPSVADVLGTPPESWLGGEVFAHVPPEDRAEQAAWMARVVGGQSIRERGKMRGPDGVTHWFDLRAKPFLDSAGRQDGVAATLRLVDDEVAAEKRAEEARREKARADELFRRSVESSAISTCLADLEGNFVDVNEALCGYFGYDAATLRHMTWQELTDPDYLQADLDNRAELLAGTAESYRMTKKFIHADGHPIWGDLSVSCVRDDEGHVEVFIGQIADVTAEVEAREQLEDARRKQAAADALYRRSVDSAAVGMCLTTPEGRFTDVNAALCQFFGYDAETLKQMTWQHLTAPEYLEADLANVAKIAAGQMDSYRLTKQFIHADGHRIWGDLSVGCLRTPHGSVERFIAQIIDITRQVSLTEQLRRQNEQIAASEETYRLLAENAADVVMRIRADNEVGYRVVWVSPNVEEVVGGSPEYWTGRGLLEVITPEDMDRYIARTTIVSEGGVFQGRARFTTPDGVMHWFHVNAKPFHDAAGHRDGAVVALRVIDDEMVAELTAEAALREKARADTRFRRSMDSAAIGMCILAPDGRFEEVNDALCKLFGYDAETLKQKSWQDLTAPQYLEEDLQNVNDVLEGRTDSYRMLKEYVHADGHRIWGDLSVSCVRDECGNVENFISQITDITAQVQADERNRALAQQLQRQMQLTTAELNSAADYMSTIMPQRLHGPVSVSSRYLPSRELGGDCFDYHWIDDDHLIVYLIDVSGHGIEPALLAVSLQNMLRSGTFTASTLLDPAAVLTELNRLFQMEQQKDHYFTIWYGLFEKSTRMLHYASAGAPPAFALNSANGKAVSATELITRGIPVGLFEDSTFATAAYRVPPGCQILIFSDGASEILLAEGEQLDSAGLKEVVTRLAGSPDWTLDDLIENLRGLTPTGVFDDDCSLIQLTF